MRSETEYRGRKITSVYLTDGDFMVTVEGMVFTEQDAGPTGTEIKFWTVEQAEAAIEAEEGRR